MDIGPVNYTDSNQWLLNLVLASMILGIALDIRWTDFKAVMKMPRAIVAGLTAQFLLLPALTTILTLFLDLPSGVELGMILVSACPGGAVSNFITHLSGGNTALSISMTACASVLAVVLMPLNFVFWAGLNTDASSLMHSIEVDATSLMVTLFIVLAIPLKIGFTLRHYRKELAKKLHKILKATSVIALAVFVIMAIKNNHQAFLSHFEFIFSVVFFHNLLAYSLGYSAGKLTGLSTRDTKATTIEVGMQNSSLAIAIVFSQFNGESGMALVSAFWATWHLLSGMLVALIFKKWDEV